MNEIQQPLPPVPAAPSPVALTAEALMKQRNEAAAELVKALLIINGGGAVALLAFLQATWVTARVLAKPTIIAIAFLSFGAALVGAFHLFRYLASWHHQSKNSAKAKKFRRLYLVSASVSLVAFIIGVALVVIGVLRHI